MILITDYGRHCKLSASQAQALCPKNTRGGGEKKVPSLSVHACGVSTVSKHDEKHNALIITYIRHASPKTYDDKDNQNI